MSPARCLCEYNSGNAAQVRYLYPTLAKKSKKSNTCYTKCPHCVKSNNHGLKVRKIHITDFLNVQTQSKPYTGRLNPPKKDQSSLTISVISDWYDNDTLFTIDGWDWKLIVTGKVSQLEVVEKPQEKSSKDGSALPVSLQHHNNSFILSKQTLVNSSNQPAKVTTELVEFLAPTRDGSAPAPVSLQQSQHQNHNFGLSRQTLVNPLKPGKLASDLAEELETDATLIKSELIFNKMDNNNELNSSSNTMLASIPSVILSRLRSITKYLSRATEGSNTQQPPLESEDDDQGTGDRLLIMIDYLRDMSTQIGEENVHEALRLANERYERRHSKMRYFDNIKNYWNPVV